MRKTVIAVVMIVFLNACAEDESQIGAQFFSDISFDIATWDTLSLQISTIRLDSIATDNSGRLLIGRQTDSIYGSISSSAFFQLSLDTSNVFLNVDDHRYDSITLVLQHDRYWYNDTTQEFTLEVYQLLEELELDDGSLYNTSQFTIDYSNDSLPLGSLTYTPEPVTNPEVEIPISDIFGGKLFDIALDDGNDILIFDTEFKEYIKGLVLKCSASSELYLGFSPDAELRLYYTDFSEIPAEDKFFSFSLDRNSESIQNIYFNQIMADQNASVLSPIEDQESRLSANSTGYIAYLKGGVTNGIRVEIPHIRSVLEDNPELLVKDVILTLVPAEPSSQDLKPLPRLLSIFKIDDDNEIYEQLPFDANLILDEEFDRDTRYEIDITAFFEEQLNLGENNENALLFLDSNSDGSASELAIGSQENQEYQSKIELNIIKLKDGEN
ncbi:MAG: DUF4270 family protein [Bacteroidota bacterium]